ncbi:MAG: metallophosphoesterase [Gammaproteobacteria bacterium]|nr:metallophosphoesterase [Gammaproteobacteria bacterium]
MAHYNRRRWLQSSTALVATSYLASCAKLPVKPKKNGLRLVFYTDVHAMSQRRAADAVLIAADVINHSQADLIMGGGDYIDGGFNGTSQSMTAHWDIYMSMHRALHAPVYPAIGNHDLVGVQPKDGSPANSDPRNDYRQRMGLSQTWYSFDQLGYHFIVLDSMTITADKKDYEGRLDSEQLAWLQQDLSRTARSTPIVVTLHMPLLSNLFSATEGNIEGSPANRVMVDNVAILELFAQHNLLLVLQGHLHVAEVIRWRNTTFITGGAICGRWWKGSRMGTEEGFYIIDLNDNKIDWQYVDYGWDISA